MDISNLNTETIVFCFILAYFVAGYLLVFLCMISHLSEKHHSAKTEKTVHAAVYLRTHGFSTAEAKDILSNESKVELDICFGENKSIHVKREYKE